MSENSPCTAPKRRTLSPPSLRTIVAIGSHTRYSGLFTLAIILSFSFTLIRLHRIRSQEMAAPAAAPAVGPVEKSEQPRLREITGSFEKNQTVSEVLLHQGLTPDTVHRIIEAARPVYNLAKVRASQLYSLCLTEEGSFRDFRYPVDKDRYLTVYHDVTQDRFVPVMKDFKFDTRVERVSATIDSSLFAAVVNSGEGYDMAMELAEIFGSDLDFNTDIQSGDSFQVLIEKKYLDGQFSQNGAILAAAVRNKDREFVGIRFDDENGKPAYYAPDGKALKRSFLKAPLKIIRITSRFSLARRHPVLKIVRPHLGVDYAAPIGTPVQAVGAGTVIATGNKGASGKMIKIRHAGGYETAYLHLSRLHVKTGARVSQGDVIGRVGSTGLSTGPHLDFRVYKNGKAINPLKVAFPPGKPVAHNRLHQFTQLCDSLMAELQPSGTESKQAAF